MRNTWAGKVVAAKSEEILGDCERTDSCPSDNFQAFNELLLLGYMEKDLINVSETGRPVQTAADIPPVSR